jgi:hypothetical protein
MHNGGERGESGRVHGGEVLPSIGLGAKDLGGAEWLCAVGPSAEVHAACVQWDGKICHETGIEDRSGVGTHHRGWTETP